MNDKKVFVDTNILVYAYDRSAGKKYEIAGKRVLELWKNVRGVLSTQVLQEFYVSVRYKIKKSMDRKIAREILEDFLKWEVVVNDGNSILEALEIEKRYKISFWDAMICASAVRSSCLEILSEDLNTGQCYHGVTVVNPFK